MVSVMCSVQYCVQSHSCELQCFEEQLITGSSVSTAQWPHQQTAIVSALTGPGYYEAHTGATCRGRPGQALQV